MQHLAVGVIRQKAHTGTIKKLCCHCEQSVAISCYEIRNLEIAASLRSSQ